MRYFHKNVRVSGSSSNLIVSVICRCSVRDYYLIAEVNRGITKVREDLTLHRSCSGNSVIKLIHHTNLQLTAIGLKILLDNITKQIPFPHQSVSSVDKEVENTMERSSCSEKPQKKTRIK